LKLKDDPLNQLYVINEINLGLRAMIEIKKDCNFRNWVEENKSKLKVS
jgi:hypothetical protein